MVAGFVLSCVGDNRTYSYLASKNGNTLADKVAKNVLSFHYSKYKKYEFRDRGSDERQYNSVGVDLPVCVVCRSKYGEYPEYHTSLDNMNLISPEGLEGAFEVYQKMIRAIENNERYQMTCCCEPQLGKRGLYPTISKKGIYDEVKSMVDFIAYADGENDLLTISNIINVPIDELIPIVKKLQESNLIKRIEK
jgi:aminopeptidase-like protein